MNQQPPDRLLPSFERCLRATNRSERTVATTWRTSIRSRRSCAPVAYACAMPPAPTLRTSSLTCSPAATAATRYKVLRVLYRWLEEEEDVPNPMAKMRPPLIPEQPVPVIPPDGLRRLLKACEGKGFEARRDRAHHAARCSAGSAVLGGLAANAS